MPSSETLPKAINANAHPTRPAPYLQSARGQRRDTRARFAWAELPEKQRMRLRVACALLYDLHGMGDTSVAELLFALGNAGILKDWGPQGDDPLPKVEGDEMAGEIWSNGGGNDGE